jgi:hypothetical protein
MIENPYSPPESNIEAVERDKCWRESTSTLYISVGSELPLRCVKCNGQVNQPPKQKTFYWHASGWYLLILFNLILYAIVALFIRKKIRLSPGLCDLHKKRRSTLLLSSLSLFSLLFIIGVATFGEDTSSISAISFLGAFVAVVIAMISSRIIYPIEINERGARFKGCGKEFLQSLSSRRSH